MTDDEVAEARFQIATTVHQALTGIPLTRARELPAPPPSAPKPASGCKRCECPETTRTCEDVERVMRLLDAAGMLATEHRIPVIPASSPPSSIRPRWACQRCGTAIAVMYGARGEEPMVCRDCWYATHDNYPADGRCIRTDPLAEGGQ